MNKRVPERHAKEVYINIQMLLQRLFWVRKPIHGSQVRRQRMIWDELGETAEDPWYDKSCVVGTTRSQSLTWWSGSGEPSRTETRTGPVRKREGEINRGSWNKTRRALRAETETEPVREREGVTSLGSGTESGDPSRAETDTGPVREGQRERETEEKREGERAVRTRASAASLRALVGIAL